MFAEGFRRAIRGEIALVGSCLAAGCAFRLALAVAFAQEGPAVGTHVQDPVSADALAARISARRAPIASGRPTETKGAGSPSIVASEDRARVETREHAVEAQDEGPSRHAVLKRLWDEAYGPYAAAGVFARMYGPLSARPLAVPLATFEDTARSRGRAADMREPFPSAHRRLSIVNASGPNPAGGGAFQVVAYSTLDGLEVIVGDHNGRVGCDEESLAEAVAAILSTEVAGPERRLGAEGLAQAARDWSDALEQVRREYWRCIRAWVSEQSLVHAHEHDVAAVFSAGLGYLHVIRRGDDGSLERLLFERGELEQTTQRAVRDALGR